ISVQEGGYF
nr:immunoglobulin heavy chain junction region [Mus musculus]